MKYLLFLFILFILFTAGCEYCSEIKVGKMYDYHFENDIQVHSIRDALDYVHNNYEHISDLKLYGIKDYWALPEEFYFNKAGDCEDFSTKFMYLLKEKLNIDSKLIIADLYEYTHAMVLVNDRYYDPYYGYSYEELGYDWKIVHVISYEEVIWMAYYYHKNVGKYK